MLNFQDVPQGGGGWFKPVDHKDAVAFLVEVKDFERQRPTPHGPKDSALVDLTVFSDDDELATGTPSYQFTGMRIEQTVLAKDLSTLVGAATIVQLAQVESKRPGSKPAWVWRQTSQDVKAKVIAFATKREEELAAAVAAAPGFDD